MPDKLGIKETSEVIVFAFTGIREGKAIMADGKFTVGDIGHVWTLLRAAHPALMGIQNVPTEFLDIDPEERVQLGALVKEQLEAAGYTVENIDLLVERGLAFIAAGIAFYEAFPREVKDTTIP